MTRIGGPFAALAALAAAFTLSAASAQPVAPAPAPAAQQAAPPDKIGPPLHEKQTPSARIRHDETTGAAPKELKPSHGDTDVPAPAPKEPPSR